jgi:hypothetical protein
MTGHEILRWEMWYEIMKRVMKVDVILGLWRFFISIAQPGTIHELLFYLRISIGDMNRTKLLWS